MTAETIRDYFLTVGATYRESADWRKDHLDENGDPKITRVGRFGVGMLAAFLIGPQIKVTTRHFRGDTGLQFTIRKGQTEEVEVREVADVPVGTQIEIEIEQRFVDDLLEIGIPQWYFRDWPRVALRRPTRQANEYTLQLGETIDFNTWNASLLHPPLSVAWQLGPGSMVTEWPKLLVDGFSVAKPLSEGKWSGDRMHDHTVQVAAAPVAVYLDRIDFAFSDPSSQISLNVPRNQILNLEAVLTHEFRINLVASILRSSASSYRTSRNLFPAEGFGRKFLAAVGICNSVALATVNGWVANHPAALRKHMIEWFAVVVDISPINQEGSGFVMRALDACASSRFAFGDTEIGDDSFDFCGAGFRLHVRERDRVCIAFAQDGSREWLKLDAEHLPRELQLIRAYILTHLDSSQKPSSNLRSRSIRPRYDEVICDFYPVIDLPEGPYNDVMYKAWQRVCPDMLVPWADETSEDEQDSSD